MSCWTNSLENADPADEPGDDRFMRLPAAFCCCCSRIGAEPAFVDKAQNAVGRCDAAGDRRNSRPQAVVRKSQLPGISRERGRALYIFKMQGSSN